MYELETQDTQSPPLNLPNSVNRIIYEASKKSKFHERKEKKKKALSDRCKVIRQKMESIKEFPSRPDVDKFLKSCIEYSQSLIHTHIYVHFDMDAFFATVEARDNPSLNYIPFAVGGEGMLCTANYKAREYGVRSAMPGYIARKLCPDLTIVPCDFEKYRKTSQIVFGILKEYDKNSISYSIDEASIFISPWICENHGIAIKQEDMKQLVMDLVHRIRMQILENSGTTCSAGIAYSRRLAKLCSGRNKPNGQFYLEPNLEYIQTWMMDQNVSVISGIGPVTQQTLREAFDVQTCGQLVLKKYMLATLYGDQWRYLVPLCSGLEVPPSSRHYAMMYDASSSSSMPQSVSINRTISPSGDMESLIKGTLSNVCKSLFSNIPSDIRGGNTLTISIKTADFEVFSKGKTYSSTMSSYEDIYKHSIPLFEALCSEHCRAEKEEIALKTKIRLIGARISSLIPYIPCTSTFFHGEAPTGAQEYICKYCRAIFIGKNDVFIELHEKECKPKGCCTGLLAWFGQDAKDQNNKL